ncbi:hypothetical protein PGTUg99_035787 [Puccinia graminis f. sp. tritici]|uniref:SMP-LTD domain-containing protein n=1 Tax=Puccinia graminis f. sp. tritici TaxID=56615 RepID=A0A5B0SMJ6_PUCGR|nr:hypothetical protein PGTUg99_035787 [Puccinia graminis f. sp. tritici]
MFYLILFVYLLGGLTFIPIIIITIGAGLYYFSPPVKQNVQSSPSSESTPLNLQEDQDHNTKYEPDSELPRLYRAGWLTVRQTYEPSQNSESTYMGLITNSYRNFMDQRSKDSKRIKPKDRFYTVLKQNVLFLYQDEDQVDCTAAIQVSLYHVDLYPTGCPDGELFVKRKAICLQPIIQNHHHHHTNKESNNQDSERFEQPDRESNHHQPGRPAAWFLFTKNNLEKEDWYHILLASSKLNGPDSKATFQKDASLFDSEDMAKLLEGIDQQPDPIPMRWMNAMLGRLFLSSYRTHALENWIIDRIMKKLAKVQTPTFLSGIKVREVNVGSTTPFFSKPMLKELTIDGDASMEVLVSYKGEFRITIETVATINLGARFKPYVVNLVLAVVLKELSGTLLLKIKRPPTNRLWFGFTAMPHLVLDLEPVVSTRQIKWALVLKPIESRIREVVMESIVYPNLDDLVFFDTQPYAHHGGIWGDAARKEKSTNDPQDDQDSSDGSASAEDAKLKTESPSSHKKSYSEPHQQPARQTTKASLNTAREDNNLSKETMRQRAVNKNPDGSEESPEAVLPTADGSIDSSPTLSLNQPENKRSSWFSATRRQDTISTQSSQASSSRNHNKTRPAQQPSSDLEDGDAVAKLQKFLRSHPESTSSHPSTPNLDGKTIAATQLPRVSEPAEIDSTSSHPNNPSANLSEELQQTPTQPIQSSSPKPADDLTELENAVGSPLARAASTHSSEENPAPLRRLPPPPRQTLPSTFLPPPTRNISNPRSSNPTTPQAVTNQSTSTNSILNQLRTRATDKEALAASVTQARDVVIKWGAAWASKRKSPQASHSHPYNSGFNPISIDQIQNPSKDKSPSIEAHSNNNRLNSLTEPVDMDFPVSLHATDESSTVHASSSDPDLVDGDEAQKAKSYRAHRARVGMGKAKSVDLSSPQSNSHPSRSTSPVLDHPTAQLRPKPSNSKLLASPASNTTNPTADEALASVGKRNRIFSSKGQFIPAAPQSTTGLSLPSAQQDGRSNHSESKLLVPLVDDRVSTTSSPINIDSISPNPPPPTTTAITTTMTKTGPGILSEGASYKPAPMMMIPGIKDSSHRFGIGSESLTTQLQLGQNSELAIPRPVVLNGSSSLGVVLADNRDSAAAEPGTRERDEGQRSRSAGEEGDTLGRKGKSQPDSKSSLEETGGEQEETGLAGEVESKEGHQDKKPADGLAEQPQPALPSLADVQELLVAPQLQSLVKLPQPDDSLPVALPSCLTNSNPASQTYLLVSKNINEDSSGNNNNNQHNGEDVDGQKTNAPNNSNLSDDIVDPLSPVDAAWGL